MKIPFTILTCFLALTGFPQSGSVAQQKIHFSSINAGGVLLGQSTNAAQLQTITGISRGSYFAGVGVGLDYYFERTVPVFLDVRKQLFDKPNTPFLYADGGYQFVWLKEENIFETEQKSGWFYEAGVGYQFPVARGVGMMLSGGYSWKQYSKLVNVMPWSSVWPPPPGAFQRYDYQLRRISVRMGIIF